jgi:hypothetical protein
LLHKQVFPAIKEKVMSDTQSRKITAKTLALVVLAAIVTAVVVTLAQRLLLGNANIAVTGGVVGAVTAVLAISAMKKNPT